MLEVAVAPLWAATTQPHTSSGSTLLVARMTTAPCLLRPSLLKERQVQAAIELPTERINFFLKLTAGGITVATSSFLAKSWVGRRSRKACRGALTARWAVPLRQDAEEEGPEERQKAPRSPDVGKVGAAAGAPGGAAASSTGALGGEDAALMASLRRRAEEVARSESSAAATIAANWRGGKARCGPIVGADDWVRRVALLDDDLFVGTASSGVRRFRLGEQKPRQSFAVKGNAGVWVKADHQGDVDPETSVTSLAFDGRWLAAGLAAGRLHVWSADGHLIVDSVLVDAEIEPRPCYVCLNEGSVIAAAGRTLHVQRIAGALGPAVRLQLESRAHSLAQGPGGSVLVGREDGVVELRRAADLELLARHKAHKSPVSALCTLDGSVVTGCGAGTVALWSLGGPGEAWTGLWKAQHRGRVVAAAEGGGGTVLTAALDGTVRAWSRLGGACLFGIPGHKVWLGSICIEKDHGHMVTDGRDNAVYYYDFRSEPLEDPVEAF